MMVWYRCRHKGCTYRTQQLAGVSYVAHRAKNGDEHVMQRERKPE
jgi:hypothetical protein